MEEPQPCHASPSTRNAVPRKRTGGLAQLRARCEPYDPRRDYYVTCYCDQGPRLFVEEMHRLRIMRERRPALTSLHSWPQSG
jgi:hypothetical protein